MRQRAFDIFAIVSLAICATLMVMWARDGGDHAKYVLTSERIMKSVVDIDGGLWFGRHDIPGRDPVAMDQYAGWGGFHYIRAGGAGGESGGQYRVVVIPFW